MLCKHTNFYLHKKGDRAAVAFFKLLGKAAATVALQNQILHITLHRLASAN
jgi:hypothetical protein